MSEHALRNLPLIRLPGPAVFPGIQAEVILPDLKLAHNQEELAKHEGHIFFLAATAGDPAVGVVAKVLQMAVADEGMVVAVAGQHRGILRAELEGEPFPLARVEMCSDPEEAPAAAVALAQELRAALGRVAEVLPPPGRRVLARMQQVEEPGQLADLAMTWDGWSADDKQQALNAIDLAERLQYVVDLVLTQADKMEVTGEVFAKVDSAMRQRHREQMLREQMRAIQEELGGEEGEWADIKRKVAATPFPLAVRQVAERELKRLTAMNPQSAETPMLQNYLEWLVNVPWQPAAAESPDVNTAARILDESHHGLDKVKERILEFIAVRKLLAAVPADDGTPRAHTPILCFVGPPGVGKTSLGQAIARATGRPFVRISLGGISDEASIRGHRRTYVGSIPGRIIHGMRQAGATNPVFLLDEVDKVGTSWRGDVSSALLEVLDPEQNHTFHDQYLEVPYDLSQVFFIATANVLDTLPAALRDRLEIIEVPGYTEDEKLNIARGHLLPKQLKAHGLPANALQFGDDVLQAMIQGYTVESGVRQLERELANLARKRARRYAAGETATVAVAATNLTDWLGRPKVRPPKARTIDEVGVATGVAFTGRGGDTLAVEVALMPGKGELLITGQLGDVMQESARAAYSVVRSRARAWGINPEVFARTQVHLHVPAGAVPKDGPSAGITMATALLSAFAGHPVRHDVAMTGELTLRGRVLPIGGLKEKTLAALRAGCTTFILPEDNADDLADISPAAQSGLTFLQATDIDQVWEAALIVDEAAVAPSGAAQLPESLGILDDPAPAVAAG